MNALPTSGRVILYIVSVFAALCLPAHCITLEEALDGSGLTWQTDDTWEGVETASARDGVDAARAGYNASSPLRTLSTTVTGPGVLSFWWQMSSDDDEWTIELFVDGARPVALSYKTFTWEQIAL